MTICLGNLSRKYFEQHNCRYKLSVMPFSFVVYSNIIFICLSNPEKVLKRNPNQHQSPAT